MKKIDLNNPCVFCNPKEGEVLAENDLAQIIKDNSPVSKGHCIVVPKRHIKTLFDATEAENIAFFDLIKKAKAMIIANGNQPDGFNIGSNNDVAAGQSVFHLHIHVIPRYLGDVENPKGGIRHVIAKNALYTPKKVIPKQ